MKKLLSIILCFTLIMSSSVFAYNFGDADGDGTVTAKDVSTALDYTLSSKKTPAAEDFITTLDLDGNGSINSADVALLLQKVLDSTFKAPVEKGDVPPYEPPTETTTAAPVTESTTQPTTVAPVTESTTQPTTTAPVTEGTTQPTTEAPADGVIRSEHEVNVNSFTSDPFFKSTVDTNNLQGTNGDYRIRIKSGEYIEFTVAKGANVYITAKHASTTDPTDRNLYLNATNGSYSKTVVYHMNEPYSEILFGVKLEGTYRITSSAHMDIKDIRITFDNVEMPTETTTVIEIPEVPSEITTTGKVVNVSDFNQLKSALAGTNADIYINNDIQCPESLRLDNKNANVNIIGVVQPDGTLPSLDFTKFRDSASSSGEKGTGIRITGTGYAFENIIVEKAPDCGIRVKNNTSDPAGDCFFKNCIFRYNNNSGISMTSGTHDVTFIAVDSYRNGDIVQKCGSDADGFSPKLNCGGNIYFYNCRAWENSDDGWDSYEQGSPYVGSVYYIECLAWNNGNPYVFTGDYDYDNNRPLDKNLLYVEQILREDPSFEAKYNSRQVSSWPKVTMRLLGATMDYNTIHSKNWKGNPNGFKFGSSETPSSSYRYIENCIAFDHANTPNQTPAKGYDQNNGSARFDIINGLSFDNAQNYWMDKMTALSQKGTALSFGGDQADTQKNLNITEPSAAEQTSLRTAVHNYRDEIYSFVYNDKTPGIRLCPVFDR